MITNDFAFRLKQHISNKSTILILDGAISTNNLRWLPRPDGQQK